MPIELPPDPRILIVRLSAIGDVICALPALTALRRHFPRAHITWLVESTSADLLQCHPHLDRVVALPRRRVRRAWRRPWTLPAALLDVWRRMRDCRRDGFDLVLDFQGNMKSGLFTGLSRGRLRVGHDRRFRKEVLNALFTNVKVHPVPEGGATHHRVERDLGLVRALGIPAVFEACPLVLPEGVRAEARAFVEALPGRGPVVILHPGTSAFGAYKRWEPPRFGALADRLVQERGARIAVSFGPGEEALAHAVLAAMQERATLFPPPRGLLFLAATLTHAALAVGSDSGPLQLAGLMGTPTLTLFGPKDPEMHKPMGARAQYVWKHVACSPCRQRVCDHVTCMRAMTVEDVAAPALAMLARAGDGAAAKTDG
ncbi:MAG: glycosyltransferase family 9 protein [Planctomycetes bacterium]|nr:glycosyltransferase family 9 protein [Planctomycetota bacterium]